MIRGIAKQPQRFGGFISVPDEDALALLPPDGLTLGTIVYCAEGDLFFALKLSTDDPAPGEVVPVYGIVGARWLLCDLGGGGGSLPTENMAAHYDAALGLTMGVSVPTQVIAWADQSGNSRNVSNNSGAATVIASAINGLPGLNFAAGLDSGGLLFNGVSGIAKNAARTVIVVMKPSSANGGPTVAIRTSPGNAQYYLFTSSGTQYIQSDQSFNDIHASAIVDYSGVPMIAVYQFTGSGAGFDFTVNGNAIAVNTHTPPTETTDNDGIRLGASNNGAHSRDITMCEAVVYSDCDGGKIAQAVSYFSHKFAISV